MAECSINTVVTDDRIIFKLEGRIDASNADEVKSKILDERRHNLVGSLVLDCEKLEYISSAGLRVFLQLLKFEKDNNHDGRNDKSLLKFMNVTQNVEDILNVTGFANLFEVSKAMRDISGVAAKKMGYLGKIAVYNINDDTLLKVYPPETTLETVERERSYAQTAFLSGVPTLIAYDIVKYHGQYGMLYELIKAQSVLSLIETAPWKLEQYAADMGRLLKLIHTSTPERGILPDTHDFYDTVIRRMDKFISPSEVNMLLKLNDAIPHADTIVYGNFNARNIFVRQDELMLINMSSISCGNPLYDLGLIYMSHVLYPEFVSTYATGLEMLYPRKFWEVLIHAYLGTDDTNKVSEAEKAIKAAAFMRTAISPVMTELTKEETERVIMLCRRKFLNETEIASMAETLRHARF